MEKTHFLSFSESKERAIEFGKHDFSGKFYPCGGDEDYDYVLLKFLRYKLQQEEEIEKGVFRCTYNPVSRYYNGKPEVILLIDTVEYLQNKRGAECAQQIENARRDEEWLILPSTPVLFNNGIVEYSALLDLHGLFEYEKYKIE